MQKNYIGYNSIKKLKEALGLNDWKRIFLVTGKNVFQSSGAKSYFETLSEQIYIDTFTNFKKNPCIEDVLTGADLFNKNKYDAIIAVGGGSSIDMAKLINCFAHNNELKNFPDYNQINTPIKPIIAVPTTAGSGSEATSFAVIYKDKTKYSLASPYLLPQITIIDPNLLKSLPPYIAACCGIDALSQAIESIWSVNSTPESTNYAKEAIKKIFFNLENSIKNKNEEALLEVAIGSNLAGKAINITKTTAPHAVSYPFTSYYRIPHGHAVGLTLTKFLEFNYNTSEETLNDKRGVGHVKNSIESVCSIIGAVNIIDCSGKINRLITNLGLELSLKKLNITDFEIIISNVNTERITNNPRKVNRSDLSRILN